jgi:hypothetical protein
VSADFAAALTWGVVILAIVVALVIAASSKDSDYRGSSSVGPGAAGAVYDLLNQDKRNAIELIVEEKAAARDPEHADDNGPIDRP